jgi:hypothetical protein
MSVHHRATHKALRYQHYPEIGSDFTNWPRSQSQECIAIDRGASRSVKHSHRPEELETSLAKYPNGHFAELVPARLSSPKED